MEAEVRQDDEDFILSTRAGFALFLGLSIFFGLFHLLSPLIINADRDCDKISLYIAVVIYIICVSIFVIRNENGYYSQGWEALLFVGFNTLVDSIVLPFYKNWSPFKSVPGMMYVFGIFRLGSVLSFAGAFLLTFYFYNKLNLPVDEEDIEYDGQISMYDFGIVILPTGVFFVFATSVYSCYWSARGQVTVIPPIQTVDIY